MCYRDCNQQIVYDSTDVSVVKWLESIIYQIGRNKTMNCKLNINGLKSSLEIETFFPTVHNVAIRTVFLGN